VAEAIAAYERTLICDDTRYDEFMAGNRTALSEEERAGLDLFNGKGACATCHTPPFFSAQIASPEGVYYNVGIGIQGKAEEEVDVGRQAVTELETDWAAFKVPSLRNVAASGPYFHDGSVDELEAAVRYMAGPGIANKNLTPLMVDRELTDEEIRELVAFLGSLTCREELVEPELPGG
jgi:cytochrome c peroxidase